MVSKGVNHAKHELLLLLNQITLLWCQLTYTVTLPPLLECTTLVIGEGYNYLKWQMWNDGGVYQGFLTHFLLQSSWHWSAFFSEKQPCVHKQVNRGSTNKWVHELLCCYAVGLEKEAHCISLL